MAQTTPPGIDPVPTPPIQRGDRATFSSRVDAFILWLVTAVTQFRAVALNVYNNAVDAFNNATAAAGSASAASGSATAASTSAGNAASSATAAATSATNSANSATASAASALALTGTSTSAVVLGTGSKAFTTQANKQFAVGVRLTAVNPSDPAQFVSGPVSAYSGTALTINADAFGGTGSVSNWNISVTGQRGSIGLTGGVNGGSLQGALWEKKGGDLASAATIDPWSAGGNFVPVTGTTAITGVTPAPQAGAQATLLATAAFPITCGTNFKIKGLPTGTSYTCSPGDEIDIRAETTTLMHVTVRKADGLAMSGLYGAFQSFREFTSTTVFQARKTGWHRVTLRAPGGRGGAAAMDIAPYGRATGGGGGGWSVGMRFLVKGQAYMFTMGAGAPGATLSAQRTGIAGAAGGAVTFSGTGVATMTANGGNGGLYSIAAEDLAGGVGGAASGGDLNVQGGNGGSIAGLGYSGSFATGAGAVGIQGTGFRGGDITVSSNQSLAAFATGGAGVGGDGGSIILTIPIGSNASTGGGGAGGAASNKSDSIGQGLGGPNYAGEVSGPPSTDYSANAFKNCTAGGSGGGVGGGPGGGGTGETTGSLRQAGGVCAGSGGWAYPISVTSVTPNATNSSGGGTGGVVLLPANPTFNIAIAGTDGAFGRIEW